MDPTCPVCLQAAGEHFRVVDGFDYYRCAACTSIYIAPEILAGIDAGTSPRSYDSDYWQVELASARDRSRSDALVRAGEAILYSQRKVDRFLDVGAGPGYLLDELAKLFPAHPDLFHAVELFPPSEHSNHPNYVIGDVGQLAGKFDAGVCVEVVEHLTPTMLSGLVKGLAKVSDVDTLWFFNTGMPDYVIHQDPGYLDPVKRGHIVSYSLDGLRHIFEPSGFRVSLLPGKTFAFIAEFKPTKPEIPFNERIYQPLPENRSLLESSGLLYQAAFESARAYYYYAEYLARSGWAMKLDAEVRSWRAKIFGD